MSDATQPREQASERILFEAWKGYPLPEFNDEGRFDWDWLHREFVAFKAGLVRAASPVAAPEAPTAWIQYVDGVKTQNVARDETEKAEIERIAAIMVPTAKIAWTALYASPGAAPEAPAAERQAEGKPYFRDLEFDPPSGLFTTAISLDPTPAATTASQSDADKLLAMRAEYDRKEGEARGTMMGGATTAGAGTPRVDALMAKWADDGATRNSAFIELHALARTMESNYRAAVRAATAIQARSKATTASASTWDSVPSDFNDWWNSDKNTAANPFTEDTPAFWAWAGWKASRATAPSRNAAPLDESAVEKWSAENIDSYFSHAPDYGSDIMWASVADIQLFLRAALTQQSAAQADTERDAARYHTLRASIATQKYPYYQMEYASPDELDEWVDELRAAMSTATKEPRNG